MYRMLVKQIQARGQISEDVRSGDYIHLLEMTFGFELHFMYIPYGREFLEEVCEVVRVNASLWVSVNQTFCNYELDLILLD